MTTPLSTSSLLSLESAWEAPRILKAPIFWKFSHLKKRLIFGRAGDRPSSGVPISASAFCGDEAMSFKADEVRTGVRWMCSLMSSSAAMTEDRVRGSVCGGAVILSMSASQCTFEAGSYSCLPNEQKKIWLKTLRLMEMRTRRSSAHGCTSPGDFLSRTLGYLTRCVSCLQPLLDPTTSISGSRDVMF